MNVSDPFGLWPTGVHDWLIARALAKVAGIGGIRAVQDGSRGVDAWRGQFGDRSFQHSMKNPFESATGAQERRNQFVASKLSEARSLEADGDHEGALGAFGAAIHPLMDRRVRGTQAPMVAPAIGVSSAIARTGMLWTKATPGRLPLSGMQR